MAIDSRIALGVQPLQVQYRDPMASYNQLAQLQSADTQNQLAQMQMQEARQLAPLRMQEQQYRAASTKLTYDEANEAQTYIKSVMAKAAEASGGSAPTNPFEAAKQMMNYPNAQVQAAGLRLLESSQKLIAFENQMANERAYEEDQRAGAPAGLPAVTAPSIGNVTAPMVAPGAAAPVGFTTSARLIQPEGKSYADMSNTERIQFDVARIQNPELGQPQAVYTLDGKEVPFREYVNANIANSTFKPDNALAAAVAPAAALPVNAMAKKAVNPLQDAAALMKQIQDGDDRFARGGTPAPGWKNKRELLIKAFEQAVKVERNQGQRYISLGAGAALDTESGLIIAKDKIPEAVAPRIINLKTGPHTLNEAGELVPVPVQGGVLPTPVAAAQPQAVAAPRIINYKGIPHTLNEAGELVPVPVAGGALPVAGKGGTGKQAASGSEKMPTGSILVIDPTDTAGKRVILVTQARAIKEGLTPASSVATGKEGGATEGERKAATLLQRLQFSESQLTEALVNNPNAAKPGVFASAVAMLSTPLANSLTPEARQRVQSAQLDILDAALTLGTGAAYTREQLEGYRDAYFPQIGDKPNQIKDKQARLNNVISAAKIAAGKAAKLVPPAPAAAGGSSAMSEADKILNKDRK